MKVYKIRCSALPAAFTCPPSVQPVDVEIDPVNEAADGGSAGHEVMQHIIDGELNSLDDVPLTEIAHRWAVEPEELKIQAFVGLGVWNSLRLEFPSAQAEVELTAQFQLDDDIVLELSGHIDVLSVMHARRRAKLGDWKFGRADKNHAHQVKGYQALTMGAYQEIEQVDGIVGWMVAREVEHYSMTRVQMWDWLEEVKKRLIQWDGTYRPGEQCTFCRRNHQCAALTAMARRDVLILGGEEMAAKIESGLADVPDVDLISVYRRNRVLSKLIDSMDEAVKRRVEAAGGVLPDGDGRELRFVDSAKRVLDPILARPVLEARLTEREIAGATVLRPSQLDKAIADKTARGGKKAAIEEMNDALQAAGAVSEEKSKRLMDLRTRE